MITQPDQSEKSPLNPTQGADGIDRPLTIFESRSWSARFKRFRIPILAVAHIVVFCLIYWFALFIRFEKFFPDNPKHLQFLPLVVGIKIAVFYLMQTFHGWWRYVTFNDLVALAKATAVSVGTFFLIDYLFIPDHISRAAILIDGAFTIAVMSALRSAWRLWDEQLSDWTPGSVKRKRALLVGADFESAKLAHLINSRSGLEFKIAGLLSTNRSKPIRYSDLRVVGHIDDISEHCKTLRIETVYVPSGKLAARELRDLIDLVSEFGIQVNVVPSMMSLLEGGSQIPIREVSFEDLLRRPPVSLDQQAISEMIEGKTILVTGAGGSIGSELCRQLIKFGPAKMILLGRGENRIYHIQRELKTVAGESELVMALASITDERRMNSIFDAYRPDVVFHAAAHKHVPMTEQNIGEAVVNNVFGTKVVADVCDAYDVKQCVMVSTDKAVNPTSIMGCTKQLAERYCLALGENSKTHFVVTRFGNVLGSEGSVVPLFKEQIQRGGPITITDPRMTRFFMTIPEAAQLVIQAGSMGKGGEIFVLEMGEAVKIVDLARDLIRLAGLPPNSIDIKFTGIRQGEKLYEELFYYSSEESLPTEHNKILTAYHRPFDYEATSQSLEQLIELAYSKPEFIRQELESLVPEFKGTDATNADHAAEVEQR
jgi:FlaA1/EpsC-like NDP-sugar epimerase